MRFDFVLLVYELFFSFLSGYFMNVVCVYFVIVYFLVKYFLFLFKYKKIVYIIVGLVMVLVGISRVYFGVYFVIDVLGGFSLGLFLFFLVKGFDEKMKWI